MPAALALGFALALGAGEAAAQNLCAGDVVTGRTTIVVCDRAASETRDVHINLRNPDISLTGHNESPVTADTYGTGSVTIEVTGGSLSSSGNWAKGIRSWSNGGSGDVAVTVKNVDITTANDNGNTVYVRRQAGTGNIKIDVSGGSLTTTGGGVSQGVTGWLQVTGDIDIDTKDVVMRTEGANSLGIFGYQQGPTGDVDVDVQGGSIETNGFLAHGVYSGKIGGTGNADASVSGASVTTRGRFTRAVNGVHSGEGDVTVDVSGEAVIVAEGEGSVGVYSLHVGNGILDATVGAATRVAAPFANGVYGRLMPSANAAGRVVIAARGRIEARDAGILAWAEPRSGSTFGDGNEAADETAGTAPMIHVTSSGDVTVGENVMDAWIRAAVAGDDGTLQAGEQAVLDAIEGGDSDALDTALGALPDDYDDAWKARMRAFQAARGAERTDHHGSQGNAPGANARLAEEAAVEILDIPRAGIRAMALSHTEIADYVRRGGLGGTLSDDERTVLAAVLTGGDLEAALAALPADYTDNWKDGVRLRAMSYNAGDISVDVTGGTITAKSDGTAKGDGVYARYVLTHDRNGAIAVTVADGATVSGERHGIYVSGAGLAAGDGGLRDQTVTVNGSVMGGTGAGVHLAGGGTVKVGATGRIGATSGDGILSDGTGDLSVTVGGTVEGDIRNMGGGALRFASEAGSEVTGTVHDPVGPLTVRGSVGRLLYADGATVTVARTGRIAGVSGETIRNAAGDLSVTVAGAVEGDIRNTGGGALRFASEAGSEVTGTVHDPVGPLTVRGSVGRLLYAGGATVTVARTGRIAGISGEAIRSAAGDLSVTVAGTVEGNVFGRGAGEHTVTVSNGGTVTGAIHLAASTVTVHGAAGQVRFDNGGAVTVGATGRIGGIEGVAVRNAADALSVAVAAGGKIEGDVVDLGDRPARVETEAGSTVTGTIDVAGKDSAVTVGGTAGRVRLDGGGRVTVGADGRITGVENEAITSERGDLVVEIQQKPGEGPLEAIRRIPGAMRDKDGIPEVAYRASDGTVTRLGDPDSTRSVPDGAFDVGVEADGDGGVSLKAVYAPRARVYEALPSTLLRLNGLPEFRERMAAGSARGGWALVESFRGKQRAERSETTGLGYDHNRYGVWAGFRGPVSENGLFGVSAHRRGGSAKVSNGGKIDLSGVGVGVSWTARLDEAAYMDLQAEWTWYDADMASRGALKGGASGRGHAVGMEVGRRTVAGGVVLTPRISMTRSTVSMNDFSDSVGARVSLTGGRSLKGRAGIGAATDAASGIRMFGSVDAEREFSKDRKVTVSGTELRSTVEPMWVRLKLGGVHAWGDGRYALRGAASWATGGDSYEFGGGVDLTARF